MSFILQLVLRLLGVAAEEFTVSTVHAFVDRRVRERRGRPRKGQRRTRGGGKDMRGRPRRNERLRKTGTRGELRAVPTTT